MSNKQKRSLKGKLALYLVTSYWQIDLAWLFNVQKWEKKTSFNFPQSHAYILLLCIFYVHTIYSGIQTRTTVAVIMLIPYKCV